MPSILGASPGRLEQACLDCVKGGADGIHIDIMDGHFVPNLSFGPSVVDMARKTTDLHLNVHLMITNPDERADAFLQAGANTLHIHLEPSYDHREVLTRIRDAGCRPGLTINPDTPWTGLIPYLDLVEEVLFMSVFPGFGGQSFIPEVLPKIHSFRAEHPQVDVAVDGGLNRETVVRAYDAGANIFLIGSHVFKAPDLGEELEWFRHALGITS